ncbi:VanZ family protein [bacterium]|nr:VanZ family protein [bacterium]
MKYRYLITLFFFICLITIEYLATTTVQIELIEDIWDKLNHFIAFFVLFVLLKFSHFNLGTFSVFLLLFLFAIQIEIVQYFIPNRYFSLLDILADGVGLGIGFVISSYFEKKYRGIS